MLDITHLYTIIDVTINVYPMNKAHMPSVYGLGKTVDNKVMFSCYMSNRE